MRLTPNMWDALTAASRQELRRTHTLTPGADPDVLLASWERADAHARHCYGLLMARVTRDRARWAHETRGIV